MGAAIGWSDAAPVLQWSVAIGASLIGATFDLRVGRIPNRLTGPVLLVGICVAAIIGGWTGLSNSLGGCLVLALPYVLLFVFAGGGAGDAKLMGAVGAWVGLAHAMPVLLAVLGAGAVTGIAFALWKRRGAAVASNLGVTFFSLLLMGFVRRGPRLSAPSGAGMLPMPYGVAICLGVCIAAVGVQVWRL